MDVAELKRKREQANQQLQQQAGILEPKTKQKLEQEIRDLDQQIKQAEGQGQPPQGSQAGTTSVRQAGTAGDQGQTHNP